MAPNRAPSDFGRFITIESTRAPYIPAAKPSAVPNPPKSAPAKLTRLQPKTRRMQPLDEQKEVGFEGVESGNTEAIMQEMNLTSHKEAEETLLDENPVREVQSVRRPVRPVFMDLTPRRKAYNLSSDGMAHATLLLEVGNCRTRIMDEPPPKFGALPFKK